MAKSKKQVGRWPCPFVVNDHVLLNRDLEFGGGGVTLVFPKGDGAMVRRAPLYRDEPILIELRGLLLSVSAADLSLYRGADAHL